MLKLFLYLLIFPFVVWIIDSIHINQIFKKNRVLQARIFYVMLVFALTYLVVNFMYDFIGVINL